jgi:hypothetical protein
MAPTIPSSLRAGLQRVLIELKKDEERWKIAKRNPHGTLREFGIQLPRGLSVAFLDVQPDGNRISYIGAGRSPIITVPRPKGRRYCPKVVRICERRFFLRQEPGSSTYRSGWETNCFELCADARGLWPWPPIPAID